MSNAKYKQDLHDIAVSVATACKNYTDNKINDLQWQLGTYDLSVDTNTDVAHIKTLPSNTIQTTVAKVEGVGYKINQLVSFDKTSYTQGKTYRDDGLGFTITSDTTAVNYASILSPTITGHKLLILPKLTGTFTLPILYLNAEYANPYNLSYGNTIVTISNGTSRMILTYQGLANSEIVLDIFDLTADFGSGNEPTSVSDCATAYLPRGINIYEYTPQQSSIKNNAFTGATVEGFNKWDEQWELGTLGGGGNNSPSTTQIRSTNYIEVLPNTTYYFYCGTDIGSGGIVLCQYDGNKTHLNRSQIARNITFTTLSNTHYIRFAMPNDYGTTYNNDICINISGSANGTYVPYIAPTTIPIDLTTIKDSNNVSLFPSGKLMGNSSVADFITPYNQESRWNEVDLGTIDDWEIRSGETNLFQSGALRNLVSKPANNDQVANALCDIYSIDTTNNVLGHTPNTIAIFPSGYIGIYDTSCSTIQELLTKLNGKKFQYERATYLTSNTDLTSLTKINAESNGTIILNNTDNVDMPNTIKSLKEVAK